MIDWSYQISPQMAQVLLREGVNEGMFRLNVLPDGEQIYRPVQFPAPAAGSQIVDSFPELVR